MIVKLMMELHLTSRVENGEITEHVAKEFLVVLP
jgi:hypothetical protein